MEILSSFSHPVGHKDDMLNQLMVATDFRSME